MAAVPISDNISELSAVLKTVYAQGVENQQNLTAPFWKDLGDADITFGGNSYEFPARMVNAQSVGARGYRVWLPQPIINQDVTARVRQKFFYASFDIAGPDIEKGKGNANAFVNTLTDKMRSVTEMAQKELNFECYGDGTGVKSTFQGTWASGVDSVDQIKYLRNGMHVNVITATDGITPRAGGDDDPGDSSRIRFTIIGLTPADANFANAPSVTLGKGIPIVATTPTGATTQKDFLVRHKAAGTELTGLDALVDDGVFNPSALILQDIDRSINPLWKAKVFSNGGTPRALSLSLMQLATMVPEVASGRTIDKILGSDNARDAYLSLLVPQKRFTDLSLDGGYQKLEYNGREFRVDHDCQDGRIYFLCKATLKKFGLFKLQFVEQGGGVLKHESLSAGDVLYGYMRGIFNLGVVQANANSKIVDLPVDSNYVLNQ